jgi:hypothetical protein
MVDSPHSIVSHVAVGAYDRSREQKISTRLWAHKHELFIEGRGYN